MRAYDLDPVPQTTLEELTPRTSGRSMEATIEKLNALMRGWFEYFKHSHWTAMASMDGYVRGRLRSILRKRCKRRGRGRGKDHQRWPNAYFDKLGLFCLSAGRFRAQSLPRSLSATCSE